MSGKYDPKHVFHYGMSVLDMDKALKGWTDIGTEILMPPAEAIGVNVLCCLMLYNDTILELVSPSNETGREQMQPRLLRAGAIDHVAYFSDDLAADLKSLEDAGGAVQVPLTFNTGFDRNMAFILMPIGFLIELMDRKATGKLPADPLEKFARVTSSRLAA